MAGMGIEILMGETTRSRKAEEGKKRQTKRKKRTKKKRRRATVQRTRGGSTGSKKTGEGGTGGRRTKEGSARGKRTKRTGAGGKKNKRRSAGGKRNKGGSTRSRKSSILVVVSIFVVVGILVVVSILVVLLASFCFGCLLLTLFFPLQLLISFPGILYFIHVVLIHSNSFLDFGTITSIQTGRPCRTLLFSSNLALGALTSKSLVGSICMWMTRRIGGQSSSYFLHPFDPGVFRSYSWFDSGSCLTAPCNMR